MGDLKKKMKELKELVRQLTIAIDKNDQLLATLAIAEYITTKGLVLVTVQRFQELHSRSIEVKK